VIGSVEQLGAKLQALALGQQELLHKGQIEVAASRPMTIFLPEFPNWYIGGLTNTSVLKKRVRW